ncbi:MAG: efflux RND transporter periplasmic adaptor subunit [Planctomycetia bacterium]|nr:efflux RND transporter periplasmic adaptor subunit [Planctomycetia bacterium]
MSLRLLSAISSCIIIFCTFTGCEQTLNLLESDKSQMESDKSQQAAASQEIPTPVLVEKVIMRKPVTEKKYVGVIEAQNTVTSLARVSGDLMKVAFKEGDLVKENDLLFEIEDIRYKAAVESAQGQIEQIKARIRYYEASYERNKELYESSLTAVSEDEVQNTESSLASARAELRMAEASLVLAQDDLKNTKIYSKINGRVGRLPYSEGNYITPSSGALITVVQLDPIYVRFSISENDFLSIFNGSIEKMQETAKIQLLLADGTFYTNGGNTPVLGEVKFPSNQIKTSVDSIEFWASFPNPDGKLTPGGIAQIHLSITDQNSYPMVKSPAIIFSAAGPKVIVVDENNTPSERLVKLGTTDGVYRAVTSGLKEGETVVIDGTHKIHFIPIFDKEGRPTGEVMATKILPVTEQQRDQKVKEAREALQAFRNKEAQEAKNSPEGQDASAKEVK